MDFSAEYLARRPESTCNKEDKVKKKKKKGPGFPGAHHPAAAGAVFGVVGETIQMLGELDRKQT